MKSTYFYLCLIIIVIFNFKEIHMNYFIHLHNSVLNKFIIIFLFFIIFIIPHKYPKIFIFNKQVYRNLD
jgi:hypothetical protein